MRALTLCVALMAPMLMAADAPPDGRSAATKAIDSVLTQWHLAASRAQLSRYMNYMTSDAVFLGTDATERWSRADLHAYAQPRFERGRGWTMRAARRTITLARDGQHAWFDEQLVTEKMGPARGSGFLRRNSDGAWKIVHYNLSSTIPNAKLKAVKKLLESKPCPPAPATATND